MPHRTNNATNSPEAPPGVGISEWLDRVSVTRKYIQEAGSCCACGRHPRFGDNAAETVREIMVGDHNRNTSSIRLCDECWRNLLLKANGV